MGKTRGAKAIITSARNQKKSKSDSKSDSKSKKRMKHVKDRSSSQRGTCDRKQHKQDEIEDTIYLRKWHVCLDVMKVSVAQLQSFVHTVYSKHVSAPKALKSTLKTGKHRVKVNYVWVGGSLDVSLPACMYYTCLLTLCSGFDFRWRGRKGIGSHL